VFLAGTDGPRRTAQIVIRQDARHRLFGRAELCCARHSSDHGQTPAATRAASPNYREMRPDPAL